MQEIDQAVGGLYVLRSAFRDSVTGRCCSAAQVLAAAANPKPVDSPGLYLAIAVLALIVALWLALQIIGFLFKLVFLTVIVLVAVAAYRAWRAASPNR